MVLQKNMLFSGTIADNIRWGNKDATLDEIKEVCHLACADEFIDQMPNGYDTWIEQGGTVIIGSSSTSSSAVKIVTLHKPFISTGYSILVTPRSEDGAWVAVTIKEKTTTNFGAYLQESNYAKGVFWRASGFWK
jgi:hypothetical protein